MKIWLIGLFGLLIQPFFAYGADKGMMTYGVGYSTGLSQSAVPAFQKAVPYGIALDGNSYFSAHDIVMTTPFPQPVKCKVVHTKDEVIPIYRQVCDQSVTCCNDDPSWKQDPWCRTVDYELMISSKGTCKSVCLFGGIVAIDYVRVPQYDLVCEKGKDEPFVGWNRPVLDGVLCPPGVPEERCNFVWPDDGGIDIDRLTDLMKRYLEQNDYLKEELLRRSNAKFIILGQDSLQEELLRRPQANNYLEELLMNSLKANDHLKEELSRPNTEFIIIRQDSLLEDELFEGSIYSIKGDRDFQHVLVPQF